jgi:hypothetical protein
MMQVRRCIEDPNNQLPSGGGASGDVVGPASAVADRIATYNGTTGKLIKDGGFTIAELATLANPTFTGDPKAPTPSPGDNDTSIATTAFVAAAITASGGVTPSALTRTNDTNVMLTLGGTPATALLQATSLTAGWSGTLAAGRGGGFGADEVPRVVPLSTGCGGVHGTTGTRELRTSG